MNTNSNTGTILVVDDETDLRDAIAFDLRRRGFTALEASNGREALEVLASRKVDVVLSDVRMPECDGIELLKQIKAANPRTPVVMLITGFSDITPEEALSLGADAVFGKPFDRMALLTAIQKAVNSSKLTTPG